MLLCHKIYDYLLLNYFRFRIAAHLSSHLMKVVKLYARGGFSNRNILMNQEFDKVVGKMPEIEVNIAAAWEHVREIERGIRFLRSDVAALGLLCRLNSYQSHS